MVLSLTKASYSQFEGRSTNSASTAAAYNREVNDRNMAMETGSGSIGKFGFLTASDNEERERGIHGVI
jgi:hypothetical protein